MEICNDSRHEPIVYDRMYCPACKAWDSLDEAQNKIEELEGEVQDLKDEMQTLLEEDKQS